MKKVLLVIEVLLYVAFMAACGLLLLGVAKHPSYEPYGGVSLIVILLVISGVHRLRCGRDWSNYDYYG